MSIRQYTSLFIWPKVTFFYAFAKSVILERKFLQMANLHAVIRETYLILLEKGNMKEAWEIIIKQELK